MTAPRRDLVLGVGADREASPDEVHALAVAALEGVGLIAESVACVASIDLKAGAPAVAALARHLGVPLRLFPAERLEAETPRLTSPSEAVFSAVGCHGVAEAAALAAAGAAGVLMVPKTRSVHATVAVARIGEPSA